MEATFKPGDDILKQLVTARREEVVRLQQSQASLLKDLEARGQERLTALKKTLPKDVVAALDSLSKMHDEAQAASRSRTDAVKAQLAASRPSPENETAVHPGLAGGHLVAPRL